MNLLIFSLNLLSFSFILSLRILKHYQMQNLSVERTLSLTRGQKYDHLDEMIPPKVITEKITLNDDCMIEIFRYLDWEDFINMCEVNPQFANFNYGMSNKRLCMEPNTIINGAIISNTHLIKRIGIEFTHSQECDNIRKTLQNLTEITELSILNVRSEINYISSEKIESLVVQAIPDPTDPLSVDHIEPILELSTEIDILYYYGGQLNQRSLELMSKNPISSLCLRDTNIGDLDQFQIFLADAHELEHLGIIGPNVGYIISNILNMENSFKSRVRYFMIELTEDTPVLEYGDLNTFIKLEEAHAYYGDVEKMELFLGSLATNHGNKLKHISIHADFSQTSMDDLDNTVREDEEAFQEWRYYFSRRGVSLTRIPPHRLYHQTPFGH